LICLFGGTFDPVHLGHLHAARSVCRALRLERIHLLLSALPGHRDAPGASVEHRWRMLELACAGDPLLIADDREVRRARRLARPSWTVETLEEIRREAPTEPLLWVIGSDAFRGLPTWHRWQEVLDLAHLVVLRRPGVPLVLSGPLEALMNERRTRDLPVGPAGSIRVLDLAMLPISATAARAALAAGGTADDLLPAPVCTYISRHHLYGVRSDPGSIA
jgi:nicotinate-nucleotide adenylyltransferase